MLNDFVAHMRKYGIEYPADSMRTHPCWPEPRPSRASADGQARAKLRLPPRSRTTAGGRSCHAAQRAGRLSDKTMNARPRNDAERTKR
jgi:hypothetical protein